MIFEHNFPRLVLARRSNWLLVSFTQLYNLLRLCSCAWSPVLRNVIVVSGPYRGVGWLGYSDRIPYLPIIVAAEFDRGNTVLLRKPELSHYYLLDSSALRDG